MKVYRDALDWVEIVNALEIAGNVRIRKSLVDQLSRASLSIPLNIAEGKGRWHKAEKRQYFWIARGSVFECSAD